MTLQSRDTNYQRSWTLGLFMILMALVTLLDSCIWLPMMTASLSNFSTRICNPKKSSTKPDTTKFYRAELAGFALLIELNTEFLTIGVVEKELKT